MPNKAIMIEDMLVELKAIRKCLVKQGRALILRAVYQDYLLM